MDKSIGESVSTYETLTSALKSAIYSCSVEGGLIDTRYSRNIDNGMRTINNHGLNKRFDLNFSKWFSMQPTSEDKR